MASSYTTSFGIEKIGSGEQSGAWGDTTNHNIDILDRIASYKSVGLSGSTHTLTVREASPGSGTENLQDGMYRVIKFTGALGANNTVTVAPNTTSAFFIIINATTDSGSSGPYSVILTQGSGANITVANGKSAVVYMDGAGSGAAVVSALADLQTTTVTTSGAVTAGTLTINSGSVTDSSGAISFGNENLVTTGTLGGGATTVSSLSTGSIISTSNADVDITPNGTGNVVLETDLVSVGGGSEVGHVSSNGANDMKISSNSGTNSGTIIITDAANGAITLAPNGTGIVDVQGSMNSSISSTGKALVFGF